jgi:hypothetical protein
MAGFDNGNSWDRVPAAPKNPENWSNPDMPPVSTEDLSVKYVDSAPGYLEARVAKMVEKVAGTSCRTRNEDMPLPIEAPAPVPLGWSEWPEARRTAVDEKGVIHEALQDFFESTGKDWNYVTPVELEKMDKGGGEHFLEGFDGVGELGQVTEGQEDCVDMLCRAHIESGIGGIEGIGV